jgi:hypothetical protein
MRTIVIVLLDPTSDAQLGLGEVLVHAAQSSDFNPRFFADANRELRRALDWFLSLKDKGL